MQNSGFAITKTTRPPPSGDDAACFAQPYPPSSQSGFSLVEVLVVLVLIGLAATVVMLTGTAAAPSLAHEADRLAAQVSAARDLALVRNRPVRVDITEDGYATLAGGRAGWTPEREASGWLGGTSATHSSGRMPATIPFDGAGLTEPAVITLYRDGRAEIIRIDGAGNVRREVGHAR